MTVKLQTEQHLESLIFKGGFTGSSESKLHIVGNHMSWLNWAVGGQPKKNIKHGTNNETFRVVIESEAWPNMYIKRKIYLLVRGSFFMFVER